MECEEMFYFLPYSLKYWQEKDTRMWNQLWRHDWSSNKKTLWNHLLGLDFKQLKMNFYNNKYWVFDKIDILQIIYLEEKLEEEVFCCEWQKLSILQ